MGGLEGGFSSEAEMEQGAREVMGDDGDGKTVDGFDSSGGDNGDGKTVAGFESSGTVASLEEHAGWGSSGSSSGI